jgi:hypothetical protein
MPPRSYAGRAAACKVDENASLARCSDFFHQVGRFRSDWQ